MEAHAFICLCFLCILNVSSVTCSSGRQGQYSNEWLLQADLSPEEVQNLAKNYGLEYSHEVLPGYYVLRLPTTSFSATNPHTLSTRQRRITDESQVKKMRQQKYLTRERRRRVTPKTINITDTSWPDMWYFQRDRVPNMNVYEVWEMGYSGAGIQIAVLDDGIDMGHPDLMNNYVAEYSYDYLYENTYPVHNDADYHGTWCAGIISAVKNEECIVGVAYKSKFSAIKTMDSFFSLTSSGEAMALIHELPHFDIYSVSWGPSDNGQTFEAPDEVVNAAFLTGVTEGRNGKGAIYTWAAGNGGANLDNCNCDGYVSSIYTISITSISMDLEEAWYAERCTSIMAGTYGGDAPNPAVSTTDTMGRCTKSFQGTSATCPMATGILAMALEANPDLTWRDVQHLVVETSSHNNLNHSTSISGAGRQVNGSNIISEHISDGCSNTVRYLEHVQARVEFQTIRRGVLEIFLTSPSGLESQLLTSRQYDRDRMKLDWTFMTVHHWGENPTGEWQLRVQTTEPNLIFTVFDWQLILYGTSTDPALGRVTAGEQTNANSSSNTGAIVGGTIGGVALLAVVIATVAAFKYCRPSKKVMDSKHTAQEHQNNVPIDGPGHSHYNGHI